jgi:hypothetical protein
MQAFFSVSRAVPHAPLADPSPCFKNLLGLGGRLDLVAALDGLNNVTGCIPVA